MESQPPVIHDIVTTSPSDSEQLEATPFVTNITLGVPLDIPASVLPPVETKGPSVYPATFAGPVADEPPTDIHASAAAASEESPADTTEPEVGVPTETLEAAAPPRAHGEADIAAAPERREPPLLPGDHPATEAVSSQEQPAGETEDREQSDIQEEMDEDEDHEEEGTPWISRLAFELKCV